MANVPTQSVLGDLGSNEYALTRKALNALLDAIFDATVTDIPTLQAAILARPAIVKVIESPELPRYRQMLKTA